MAASKAAKLDAKAAAAAAIAESRGLSKEEVEAATQAVYDEDEQVPHLLIIRRGVPETPLPPSPFVGDRNRLGVFGFFVLKPYSSLQDSIATCSNLPLRPRRRRRRTRRFNESSSSRRPRSRPNLMPLQRLRALLRLRLGCRMRRSLRRGRRCSTKRRRKRGPRLSRRALSESLQRQTGMAGPSRKRIQGCRWSGRAGPRRQVGPQVRAACWVPLQRGGRRAKWCCGRR